MVCNDHSVNKCESDMLVKVPPNTVLHVSAHLLTCGRAGAQREERPDPPAGSPQSCSFLVKDISTCFHIYSVHTHFCGLKWVVGVC